MKTTLLYFTILLNSLFGANAQISSDTISGNLTLRTAVEIALKNNMDVQRSNIRAETERVNFNQARANLLPNLNINYSHGINAGRSIDPYSNAYVNQQITFASPAIESKMTLFNGFALLNTIRRNSLTYKAARFEEQQAKENLTINVILTYLQVLTNQELLEQSIKQKETSLRQVEWLEVLFKSGAVLPGQYYDLKGQYANDQMAVVTAVNNLENSKIVLVQLLNIPYTKDMKAEKFKAGEYSLIYETTPEQVYSASLEHLALVKATGFRKKSADEDIKVKRSAFYPLVFLNGGLTSNYSSAAVQQSQKIGFNEQLKNNLSPSVSIGISIPLLNSFRTRNSVAIAKLNQQEADLAAKSTRIQLQQLTEQAYFNMTSSKDRYATLLDQVNAFSESFRTTEIRFNAGAITSVDYLIAKNNLDRANLNLLSARYDFILRKKILDFYQGKPLW